MKQSNIPPSRSHTNLATKTARILTGICMFTSCVAAKETPSNTFQQWAKDPLHRRHQELRHPLPRRTTGAERVQELENEEWTDLSKEEKKDILQQKESNKNDVNEEDDAEDPIEVVSGGMEVGQMERPNSEPNKKKQKKKNNSRDNEKDTNLYVVVCICDDDSGNERRELREYVDVAFEEWNDYDWVNGDIIGFEEGLPSAFRSLGVFDIEGENVTSPTELGLHREKQKGADDHQDRANRNYGKSGKGYKLKNSKANKIKKGTSKMGGKSSKLTKPCNCRPVAKTKRPTNKPTNRPSNKKSRKPVGEKPYSRRPTNKPNNTSRPAAEKPKTRRPTRIPTMRPMSTRRPTRNPIKTPKPVKTRKPKLKPIKTRKPTLKPMRTKKPSKTRRPTEKPIKSRKPVKTKRPTLKPIKTRKPVKTKRPTLKPIKTGKPVKTTRPTLKPNKTSKPTMKPSRTKKPTLKPTRNNIFPPKPTSPPTLPPTKAPTQKPTSQPTKSPSKAPTPKPTFSLLYSVDICYPGCGNFTDIYTQNQFQSLILKYVPCSSSLCTLDIIFQSGTCTTCSIDSSQRSRLLQVNRITQSSTIAFTIKSKSVLDNQAVTSNLNSNTTNMNLDLKAANSTFRISSNFTQVPLSPTRSPSRKPTSQPSKAPNMNLTLQPTKAPAKAGPTNVPTKAPTEKPTSQPTKAPIKAGPTNAPTKAPTKKPTLQPTKAPIKAGPTNAPTRAPSRKPTSQPTKVPIKAGPTYAPIPTKKPTLLPTKAPVKAGPTNLPTRAPTKNPSSQKAPTKSPVRSNPTLNPTRGPNKPTTPVPTGGQQMAVYDSNLTVPQCSNYGSECNSGILIQGRGNIQGGKEPNQPNTLDVCVDGDTGSPTSGSIEKLIVKSGDINGVGSGVDMVEGSNATIVATVISTGDWSRSFADFYFASVVELIPDWKFIATVQHPGVGQQVLQVTYVLPSGGTEQAVRVNFRYRGSTSPCSSGGFDDVDDLVFKVRKR